MKIKVTDVARHRNGIAGEPFYVVLFTWKDGTRTRKMSAIVFDSTMPNERGEWSHVNCRIAVLDRDMTAQENINFGENSWRGDDFANELIKACTDYDARISASFNTEPANV